MLWLCKVSPPPSSDSHTLSRRAFLGAAVVTSLSGCQGILNSSQSPGARLSSIAIFNRHDQSHTVDVRVDWEDETVLENEYALDANDPSDKHSPSVPRRERGQRPAATLRSQHELLKPSGVRSDPRMTAQRSVIRCGW